MNGPLLALLCVASGGAVPSHATCDELARNLEADMDRTTVAMEPESALAGIYDEATGAEGRCLDNQRLAYLRLRAAELGRGAPVGRQPAPASDEWRKLAEELAARFPRSWRIATVRARASGTVADARNALALDPTYIPARVALAAGLLTSSPAEGATYLAPTKDLVTVSDGYTVLARTRWALHDAAGAIAAAKRRCTGAPCT